MNLLITKTLLTVAISIAAINGILAQSYTNSPGDSLEQSTNLEQTVVMNITQLHPTSDTLYFHWRKIEASLPTGWVASLCDNGACFSSLPDSGMMIPIVPGDNGLMSLHCTPQTTMGTAIIRYLLYATATPARIDTLTWIINATTTGIEEANSTQPVIYNSNGVIYCMNIQNDYTEIKVYSLDGREVLTSPIMDRIIVPDTKKQMVIVVLKGKNKTYCQRISLR